MTVTLNSQKAQIIVSGVFPQKEWERMMQLHKEHFSDLYYLQTQAVPRLRKKKALNLLTISLDFFNCTANPSFSNTFQKTSFITLLE